MKTARSIDDPSIGILQNTFCHIPSVTPAFESKLWKAGIQSWGQAHGIPEDGASEAKRKLLNMYAARSARELHNLNVDFFSEGLPAAEHWRLFPEFRDHIAYVDIETTGLSAGWDKITTIALYDGRRIRWYVNGENLTQFKRDIGEYKLIVTYNGKCFDVPFLRAFFNMNLEMAHIDLRYVLKSLGYSGGLKGCERRLGIDRGDLEDVDGFFAVLLWDEFKKKRSKKALETLLAYNIQDVMNLEKLLVIAYNKKIGETPFSRGRRLGAPKQPSVPFKADAATIRRIKREISTF